MKKFRVTGKFEIGQVLPLVVLMMVAILAMVALILDGGSVMANRRTAQAAADAGAMAGAQRACSGNSDAVAIAEAYATKNGAQSAVVSIAGSTVTVEAMVENPSFFAKVFGEETLTATADAAAGCYPPSGNELMPIAWSCKSPVGYPGATDPGKDCVILGLDWDNLLRPLVKKEVSTITIPGNTGSYEMDGDNIVNTSTNKPPVQIYIILDDLKSNEDIVCVEDEPANPDAITCDLNGDKTSDIMSGGSRGWLDLDGGGGGASDIKGWIEKGFDGTISPHTWLPTENGKMSTGFQHMKARVGDVVLIPVFNGIPCDLDKDKDDCLASVHTPLYPEEPDSGDIVVSGNEPHYHVVTFAPFYVSCVHDKPNAEPECPGFELAVSQLELNKNTLSVEGYFLENYTLALDADEECDVNLANCTISLIH